MQNKAVTLVSQIITLFQIMHACFPYRLAHTDRKKALAFIYIKIQFLVCLVKQDSTTFPGISN